MEGGVELGSQNEWKCVDRLLHKLTVGNFNIIFIIKNFSFPRRNLCNLRAAFKNRRSKANIYIIYEPPPLAPRQSSFGAEEKERKSVAQT